jgi:23S rRNA (cytidine2498-2'-O)-methyltransferase
MPDDPIPPADVLVCAPEDAPFLLAEVARRHPDSRAETVAPGLVGVVFPGGFPALPFAFARQLMPAAAPVAAASIRIWAESIAAELIARLPDGQPWRLHLWPHYGTGTAGNHRCDLIRAALDEQLQRRRRHLRKRLVESDAPFAPDESLVQIALTGTDTGFLSIAAAPLPRDFRASILPYTGGWIPVASDKAAPSRAFAKLLEAERRLGRAIAAGESCVDLGACPGSWTYIAVGRGARVTSIDRSPLRDDLMRDPKVTFHSGDAFKYRPETPADWLVCDVIAAPQRSIALAMEWAERGWARHLVVTIKFKGTEEYPLLDALLALAPRCAEFRLARLCANKNEACLIATLLT